MKNKIYEWLEVLLSISGFVPRHATWLRILSMIFSLGFLSYIGNVYPDNPRLAAVYFFVSTLAYIGFIYLVLPENGYRKRFIAMLGEERGYRCYEGILSFLFFHSGSSIGYLALTTQGEILGRVNESNLALVTGILFMTGLVVKTWAAKVVSIDIYYWKDMFLGRKIHDFVSEGPYRYFSNPMYGIGQLQSYAVALMYGSSKALIAALIYQCAVFTFYHSAEKGFIRRVYTGRKAIYES